MSSDKQVVYVDIETTGLGRDAEIVQIAAKCAGVYGATFSAHALPTGWIPHKVTEITGLQYFNGQLFLRGVNVHATTLESVCKQFVRFLQRLGKSVVLVGHNSFSFDFPRIYRMLDKFDLLKPFSNVVCSFADTLKIFENDPAIRQRERSLKLSVLAEKYVPKWNMEIAHEALSDCMTLESICEALQCTEEILIFCISIEEFTANQIRLEKQFWVKQDLWPLRGVISKDMVQRLAKNGLSMQILRDAHRSGNEQSLHMLLAEVNECGKPRITKNMRIIRTLAEYFQQE